MRARTHAGEREIEGHITKSWGGHQYYCQTYSAHPALRHRCLCLSNDGLSTEEEEEDEGIGGLAPGLSLASEKNHGASKSIIAFDCGAMTVY